MGDAQRRVSSLCGVAAARLLAALAVAALPTGAARAGGPDTAQAAAWHPVDLTYEVHAGGLHAFTIQLEAALDRAGYDLSLALRTDGTLAWFLDWTMSSVARGRPGAAGLAPARFRTESQWRGRERWVEVRYDGAGAPEVAMDPPPDEEERDVVPEAQRAGTIDPISAALALIYAVAWDDGCELSLAVFDGRRRYNARSRDDGEREIAIGSLSPYGGTARACAVTLDPVNGFRRNAEHKPRREDFTVFLRQVVPEAPPLPVRVEAETRFGGIRIHLVDLEVRPQSG